MTQKVLRVGTSAAVTIPKKSLKELGIKIGDEISIDIDRARKTVLIKPTIKLSPETAKIAKLTLNFINRYRKDLEKLANS